MARRRKKKNPLLMRIILISVAVHVVALPILAHYGAFKKFQKALGGPTVVIMPPPPPEKEREVVRKKVAQKVAQKGPAKGSMAKRSTAALPVHVVATNTPGPATGGGTEIVNGTNTKIGVPPVAPPAKSGPPSGAGSAPPPPTPPPTRTQVAETTLPPTPAPAVPAKPHVPVVVDASPTFSPSPVIPDDLRVDALDSTVVVQFMVSSDGSPSEVKVTTSSGNEELDSLALEAAKKWRFKPATRDGQPIESRVILHIEFEVQ